jgi:hypothetical protein
LKKSEVANFLQLLSALREQMNATLWRSDVLKPLAWLIGVLMLAMVILALGQAPNWLLILMAVLLLAIVALYGGAYVFCLLNDRDALRSEKYSLHKMAIEHRLIGDNSSGLFEAEEVSSQVHEGGTGATKRIEQRS